MDTITSLVNCATITKSPFSDGLAIAFHKTKDREMKWINIDDLKQLAIKCIKSLESDYSKLPEWAEEDSCIIESKIECIKHIFEITDEDLENEI